MPPFKVHYVHALQHDVIESIMFPHSKIVTVILATTLTLGDWLASKLANTTCYALNETLLYCSVVISSSRLRTCK